MAPHILHQALDDQQTHHEGHHTAHHQHTDFRAGGADAGQQKFQHLDSGGPQHGGNRHEEGEFRAGTASYAN